MNIIPIEMKDEYIESILIPTDTLSRAYCASLDWKLKELAKNEISIDELRDWYNLNFDGNDDVEEFISKYKPFLREEKLKSLGI